jgi:hypothetical protein
MMGEIAEVDTATQEVEIPDAVFTVFWYSTWLVGVAVEDQFHGIWYPKKLALSKLDKALVQPPKACGACFLPVSATFRGSAENSWMWLGD